MIANGKYINLLLSTELIEILKSIYRIHIQLKFN